LHPSSILLDKGGYGVADVSYRESAVQNNPKKASRAIWAIFLAGYREELIIQLLKHYKKAKTLAKEVHTKILNMVVIRFMCIKQVQESTSVQALAVLVVLSFLIFSYQAKRLAVS
jgi:hypothetical protein